MISIKNIFKKFKEDKYLLFLGVLSFVIILSVIRYAMRTFKIPEWDEQHYMRMATEFYRIIKYNLSTNTPYEMLQIVPFRQIGYPLLITPFLLLFGLSKAYFWAVFTNGLLYIATIFGIYFISKNFMSKPAAFTASVIFTFYGWTLLHLHLSYSETATSAFSVLTILFLIKSQYFKVRKYSILFGVFLGISLFVKWISLVFISGPLIYVLYQVLKKKHFRKNAIVINILWAAVIAFAISIYPYYQNLYWIIQYFYGHREGGSMWQIVSEQERNPLSLYSLTFYLNSFAQLGITYFVLIITGFLLAFRSKSRLKPILFAVIVSYLFSAFALLKAERHNVPIYPYLAILSASVIDYIKNKQYKNLFVLFILALSFLSFLGSTWGRGPMKESLAAFPIELNFGQMKKIYLTTISRPPYIYKISGKEILDYISKDSKESEIRDPQILSLFYFRPLDEPLMTYNLYNQEKILSINNFIGTTVGDPQSQADYLLGVIKDTDYILTKSGIRTDQHFSQENYEVLKALIETFDNFEFEKYYAEKKKIWIYQDSSEVSIYKKTSIISKENLEDLRAKLVEALELYK